MANGVAKVARRLQEAKETGKLGNYLRKENIQVVRKDQNQR